MSARVVVGISGGVDSSVAALLLRRQGYEVVGLFMNNWDDGGGQCTAAEDWADASAAAAKLGIPHYSVDFSTAYMERVFKLFLAEYEKGRTPNPDVLCNREIKFGPFRDYAKKLGADYIATGHYCGITHAPGGARLMKAADETKDQTYFLNQVRTEQLSGVLFPLARLRKSEVRRIAAENNLVTAKKKDSTGICFIGERRFKQFLSTYLPARPGDIRDLSGKKIGRHDGLMYYTLGQRRGLGIGGVAGSADSRWYVVDKNLAENVLVVSCGEGEELYSGGLVASGFNLIGEDTYRGAFDCAAKMRYRQSAQPVTVTRAGEHLTVEFHTRQRAVTPGQYVVLYDGERCLGGGVIDEVIKKV